MHELRRKVTHQVSSPAWSTAHGPSFTHSAADVGGVQGTEGDMSIDNPDAQPKNEEAVCAAPPEPPARDLQQYKQAVMSLLQPGETVPAALRSISHMLQVVSSRVRSLAVGWVSIAAEGSEKSPVFELVCHRLASKSLYLFQLLSVSRGVGVGPLNILAR